MTRGGYTESSHAGRIGWAHHGSGSLARRPGTRVGGTAVYEIRVFGGSEYGGGRRRRGSAGPSPPSWTGPRS